MNSRIIIIIVAVLAIALLIFTLVGGSRQDEEAAKDPTTFEECIALYPSTQEYPRRCVTPSGLQFSEAVATTTEPVVPAPTSSPTAPTPTPPQTSGIPNVITVKTPTRDQKVSSPITITGEARGGWYFEASFPVELRNASGTVIARHYAEAQSDWMTENFVPFRSTLTFPAQPAGSKGTLILRKDNPSGDPARDQSVSIPVTF
ncbi:MAG TPA: Gmad2 immunoglobulin-like domain-containing protein [Candidatus Paceibacterota bacterium]